MKMLVLSAVLAALGMSVAAPVMAQDRARDAQIAAILKANGMGFVSTDLKVMDFSERAKATKQSTTPEKTGLRAD